jgi:hypothetical protein
MRSSVQFYAGCLAFVLTFWTVMLLLLIWTPEQRAVYGGTVVRAALLPESEWVPGDRVRKIPGYYMMEAFQNADGSSRERIRVQKCRGGFDIKKHFREPNLVAVYHSTPGVVLECAAATTHELRMLATSAAISIVFMACYVGWGGLMKSTGQ